MRGDAEPGAEEGWRERMQGMDGATAVEPKESGTTYCKRRTSKATSANPAFEVSRRSLHSRCLNSWRLVVVLRLV